MSFSKEDTLSRTWKALLFILVLVVAAPAIGQVKEKRQQIAEAVLPLPESLRADATVVEFDADAKYSILREGTNDWICRADEPTDGFSVACYHKNLFPLIQRFLELSAQATDRNEILATIAAEMKSGKLKTPDSSLAFVLRGPNRRTALPLTNVWIPFATAASTGLPTEPDPHRPWLMNAGTPGRT